MFFGHVPWYWYNYMNMVFIIKVYYGNYGNMVLFLIASLYHGTITLDNVSIRRHTFLLLLF